MREPGEERFPGQHEPRNPHAHERHHRHDRAGCLATELSTKQQRLPDTVQQSAKSLLRLLNDILDFSKIDADRMLLERIPYVPRQIVEDAAASLAVLAHEKHLELIATIDPHVPDFVLGDPNRIGQVVTNLLGNAIKFTESGEVEVGLQAVERRDRHCRLELSIRDTGVGIDPQKVDAIFDAFRQADSSTTRRFGGTGLGLAITKKIIRLMGGSIRVKSEPGVGSTFRADFCVEIEDEFSETASMDAALIGRRALVVMQNARGRQSMADKLATLGLQVVATESWPADAAAAVPPYEVVLIEPELAPPEDPPNAAGGAGTDSRPTASPPRIAPMTSRADQALELDSRVYCDQLTKPVRLNELRIALMEALSSEPAEASGSGASPFRTLTKNRRILLAEDCEINQQVARGMLELMEHRVDVVANGAEAVEAAATGSYDLIFMDLEMPVMDGLAATALIRQGEAGAMRRQRIVAMTAHVLPEVRDRCLAAGMDGFLTKPIQPEDLVAAINRYCPAEDPLAVTGD